MAADGFNSLLNDLALPYPYEPRNWLRVVTGAGAGFVLAVALCFLLSVTLWRTVDARKQNLESWWLPVQSMVVVTPLLLIAVSGIEFLYAPVVLTLIFAALAALSSLALVVIVILRKMEYRFASPRQVEPVVVPAMALALLIMLAMSAGRTVLERFTGPSNLV
jgi:integral membrane sensor domain MASE1